MLESLVSECQAKVDNTAEEIKKIYASFETKGMDYFDALFKMISKNGWVYDENVNNTNKKDEFYTTNTTVLGALANSMFGWGFQATTTWMNYVKKANLRLKRDVANNIVEAEIGLTVLVSVDGASNSQEEIYYKMSNFNSTKVEEVENFYNKTVKGA